jgi:predicted transcriptional regulator
MSSPVVFAGIDSNVDHVVRTMLQNEIRRVPVIKGGKIVGILTESDIMRQLPDLMPRVRKTMGWDYVDPRVTREMEDWFQKNEGKSWDAMEEQFPKWYSFLEERNMVREGELQKVHGIVKKAFEERKAA